MVYQWIDRYCRALGFLMVAALAVMVVLVFGNVVLRYGFNSGFTVSEELSRWLFVWMTFLGAVVAMHERTHLGTDMLVGRLGKAGKKLCLGLCHVLMLCICWLVFDGALSQTRINWESTSAAMEVSMGGFYLSGVVFAVSAGVILAADFWRLVSGQMSDAELVGIQESEEHAAESGAQAK
jgi:TRAP-type transport system small permease protein